MQARLIVGTVLLLTALTAFGQDVTIGKAGIGIEELYGGNPQSAVTVIDLSAPAIANGSLTTASLRLETTSTCTGATFRLRFLRPARSNGYTLVAERGPFNATRSEQTVTLDPPVEVLSGDRIAIALSAGACGVIGYYDSTQSLATVAGDYKGGALNNVALFPNQRLALRASSASPALVGYVPAVGIVAGGAGSSFNTSFTISNPSSRAINLRFVYRANGKAGSASDPSTTFQLKAGESASPDLLQMLGIASGVGSLDVFSDGIAPSINARVYNSTATGTNGFSETLVPLDAIPHEADLLVIPIPSDLTRFRVNLGMRGGAAGGALHCVAYAPAGTESGFFTKRLGADTFEQNASSAFFAQGEGGLAAGGQLLCQVDAPAIFYATVTDNATNDSALVMATRP